VVNHFVIQLPDCPDLWVTLVRCAEFPFDLKAWAEARFLTLGNVVDLGVFAQRVGENLPLAGTEPEIREEIGLRCAETVGTIEQVAGDFLLLDNGVVGVG